jgi:hypothetical protein
MNTLVEQPGSGDSKTAIMCQEDTLAEIRNLLQNFDVLTSRIERYNFKYAYIFLSFLYLADLLQALVFSELSDSKESMAIDNSLYLLFLVIGISLILWIFKGWQRLIPKTLGYLFFKSRIFVPAGDVNIYYLHFLEEYRDALRKPLRYLLVSSLLVIMAFYYTHSIFLPNIHNITSYSFKNTIPIVFIYTHLLFTALTQFGAAYYLGIVVWVLCISGRYITKLVHTFEIKIEPLHPDKCGGLKVLGNFCFNLAGPIFIGSAFFIGYVFFVALRNPNIPFYEATRDLILLVILVYGLPTAIIAFFLPLWNIHTKMLHEREVDDEGYAAKMEVLRQTIQELLNEGKIEEARNLKEKMDLTQALYTTYPRWPFNVRARFLSSFLALSSSLLLGFLTALQQPLVELILRHIGSKP